ncbi:MAG: Por secretion system protein, partial [Bacteroidaceae bacterium]|nr:Por secretion system protein [Bacteroidaceae bacterium]
GCLNYFDKTFYDGTLMMYEEGTWTSFQEEGIAEETGVHYKNLTSIVQDPKDENHHYASSFGQGIYEFRDMQLVAHYDHNNSPLESASPNSKRFTRISRLKYDKQGNLWITNADGGDNVKSPLKILKPDGTMIGLYYKELEKLPTVTEVLFDQRGRVWVVSMRYDVRLFCIDLNGTLENTADDRIRTFNEKFTDQDGQSTEVYYINDIAEDLNGDIWVMTDAGPYVLYNTEKVFNTDYRFTKIKVPRNDGTNYADYLLNGVYTTCIEIDAANRKWIGTLNNGLYLIGPDGLENVHHFTKDNSPLPSNAIESLALQHTTGELYIGTDKGLVSYTTDATRGASEYDEEKVYAYPNPVTPDYNGPITIVGLKANSNVKITNTAGRLVAEGTSLGGSFTWDGKTPQGQRVATGVYYVLGTDEEGQEGIVTKILFIK